jgi:hypothetical protein
VKSKALVQAKHTITRLTEAEKLASIGTLNINLGAKINQQFQAQAQQTIQDITTLKDSGALIDAAKISSSFESSLVGQQEKINQLDNSSTTQLQTRNSLANIVVNIKNQIEVTSGIQDNLDTSIATSSDQTAAKNYAEDRLRASQEKISELKKHVQNSSPVNQKAGEEIQTNINTAQGIINQSQHKIGNGSLNDAFKLLKQADQTTEKAAEVHDFEATSSSLQDTNQVIPAQTTPATPQSQGNIYNNNNEINGTGTVNANSLQASSTTGNSSSTNNRAQ